MKITFVLEHASMAGGIRVVAIYADRLRRRGHEVTIVSTPRKEIPLRRKVKSLVLGAGWPSLPRTEPSHLDDIADRVPCKKLNRWRPVVDADVPDADAVIATWWETAEWVAALSPRKGKKFYLIQHHEMEFESQPSERVAATWRLPLQKITISHWLTRLAESEYGDRNAVHVPNSVDTEQFRALPRGKHSRPTVGMLYSPSRHKGCDVSLAAMRQVTAAIPDVQLITFGAQPVSEQMPVPAGAEFILRPPQDQIRDIYARCDVWLCGSYSEGFHLPPLEAMACRCPVVSTRVGGPEDVIENGRNGYLVPVGDSAALADRLIDVLRLPADRWLALSDAAYATATGYTWDDATAKLESALQNPADHSKLKDFTSRNLELSYTASSL